MTVSTPDAELRQLALQALCENSVDKKVALTLKLPLPEAICSLDNERQFTAPAHLPGRPEKPTLHSYIDSPKRSPFTPEGLASLLHAVTHIEFNAINLALDAVWRFNALPPSYYLDWVKVAADEAKHFSLLRALLQSMGYDYGDFPAHTGLWDMAQKTEGDVLARMALVPRTLEARGLDATPPMQAKLRKVGSPFALRAVSILDIILHDEISHVAVGNRWYRHLCTQRALNPITTYPLLAQQYGAPRLKGPLNISDRLIAGFTMEELNMISPMH